jgi:hypothetical protein
MKDQKKILLIQLGSYGDCVMVTTVARQIKVDYPDCQLTWAVMSRYAGLLINNPDVDVIWKVEPTDTAKTGQELWDSIYNQANGHYDLIYTTQVYPNNVALFDGTIRSSLFRGYPNPITVPVVPIVHLTDDEYEHVRVFAERNKLSSFKKVVLMECTPSSGQSKMDLSKGIEIANAIITQHQDTIVLISTHVQFSPPNARILHAGELSFRENIALSHYCTFFIGCSSGLSWLMLTDSAKKMEMIIYVSRIVGICFASLVYDLKYWKLPCDHIIENDTSDLNEMKEIALQSLDNFGQAHQRYHKEMRPAFWSILLLIKKEHFVKSVIGLVVKTRKYYFQRNAFTLKEVLSFKDLKKVLIIIIRNALRKKLS